MEPHLQRAYETYIRGSFGQTIANPATWSTILGTLMTLQGQKNQARQLLTSHPPPTETALRQAGSLVDSWRRQATVSTSILFAAAQSFVEPLFLISLLVAFTMLLVATGAIPGIVAALLFRGGLVLWTLGLEVVTKNGTKASRGRVLWRALLAWSPLLAICPLLFRAITAPNAWLARPLAVSVFILCCILTVWSLLLPERSLQDRLAGTALVPR